MSVCNNLNCTNKVVENLEKQNINASMYLSRRLLQQRCKQIVENFKLNINYILNKCKLWTVLIRVIHVYIQNIELFHTHTFEVQACAFPFIHSIITRIACMHNKH